MQLLLFSESSSSVFTLNIAQGYRSIGATANSASTSILQVVACITDLPPDTLLYIVGLDRANQDSRYERTRRLRALSLICTAFSAACAHFLFHTHSVRLRKDSRYDGPKRWDAENARARLAVLDRWGTCVRELTVRDVRSEDVVAFPDEIMDELSAKLRALEGLTSLALSTGRAEKLMPVAIWDWIRSQSAQLKSLTIKGWWTVPAEPGNAFQPIDGIGTLTLEPLSVHTEPFLSLVKTPKVVLRHHYLGKYRSELYPYRPSAEDTHLRDIYIDIERFGGRFDEHEESLYDFSNVQQADIVVQVNGSCELKGHIPGTWKRVKDAIRKMFCESLSTYDVSRPDYWQNSIAVIVRRAQEGWKPVDQVHLQGKEYEDEEQKAMDAYYAMRMSEKWYLYE